MEQQACYGHVCPNSPQFVGLATVSFLCGRRKNGTEQSFVMPEGDAFK